MKLAPQASASAIPPLARAPAGLTGSLRRGRARNDTSRCPIRGTNRPRAAGDPTLVDKDVTGRRTPPRSEEHTSELQSRFDLVCRLLLEKKKTNSNTYNRQPHAE